MLEWMKKNNDMITWWIIGWMSFSLVDSVLRENWGFALLDVILIYLNYKLWKENNA